VPFLPPAGAGGKCAWQGILRFLRTPRKKHDPSAVGTLSKVSKRLQTLVIRQGVFSKGAELICVRMVAVMEKFAHGI
jgi:hypothetical protein